MNRLSVGESRFGFEACRGAYDLAREDAERSEWLARRAKEVSREDRLDPAVCECGTVLHENAKGVKCARCLKRDWMRMARRKEREAERSENGQTVGCVVCGESIPKWSKGGDLRRVCDDPQCMRLAKGKRHLRVAPEAA